MYSAKYIILTLEANNTTIVDRSLTNANILKVKMDGDGYDIVYTTEPERRQVLCKKKWTRSGVIGSFRLGSLTFAESSPTDRQVYVLIKQ